MRIYRVTPAADRLWARVDKNGPEARPGLGPCWLWLGAVSKGTEYGVINVGKGRLQSTHRLSYELAFGATDLCVLHRCDVRHCVRPDHLFAGTHADNHSDMRSKGRARGNTSRGNAHHRTKLSDEDLLAIRVAWKNRGKTGRSASGLTLQQIAEAFGISATGVRDAIFERA